MSDYRELFEKIPDRVAVHDAEDGSLLNTNESTPLPFPGDNEMLVRSDVRAH